MFLENVSSSINVHVIAAQELMTYIVIKNLVLSAYICECNKYLVTPVSCNEGTFGNVPHFDSHAYGFKSNFYNVLLSQKYASAVQKKSLFPR